MEKKTINGSEVMNRIKTLLKASGTTRDKLAEYIGKNKQVFTDWKANNIVPKSDDLYNIAKYFNVSMEYLLFGEDVFPDNIAVVSAMISTVSEEKQKILIDLIVAQCKAWRENGENRENIH